MRALTGGAGWSMTSVKRSALESDGKVVPDLVQRVRIRLTHSQRLEALQINYFVVTEM